MDYIKTEAHKVVVVGPAASGKSTLLEYLSMGYIEPNKKYSPTIGCRIKRITIHRGMKCIASLWELGGTRLYKELHDAAYKDANCVILMCDISGLEKIEVIGSWIEHSQRRNSGCELILVGNKRAASVAAYSRRLVKKISNLYNICYVEVNMTCSGGLERLLTIIGNVIKRHSENINLIETSGLSTINQQQFDQHLRSLSIESCYCCPYFDNNLGEWVSVPSASPSHNSNTSSRQSEDGVEDLRGALVGCYLNQNSAKRSPYRENSDKYALYDKSEQKIVIRNFNTLESQLEVLRAYFTNTGPVVYYFPHKFPDCGSSEELIAYTLQLTEEGTRLSLFERNKRLSGELLGVYLMDIADVRQDNVNVGPQKFQMFRLLVVASERVIPLYVVDQDICNIASQHIIDLRDIAIHQCSMDIQRVYLAKQHRNIVVGEFAVERGVNYVQAICHLCPHQMKLRMFAIDYKRRAVRVLAPSQRIDINGAPLDICVSTTMSKLNESYPEFIVGEAANECRNFCTGRKNVNEMLFSDISEIRAGSYAYSFPDTSAEPETDKCCLAIIGGTGCICLQFTSSSLRNSVFDELRLI